MPELTKERVKAAIRNFGLSSFIGNRPKDHFHSDQYMRHNARRLEHLASLGIVVANRTVLEVGAGIGDHTNYYIDRGCDVTITEGRLENIDYLRKRYPQHEIHYLDMEKPEPLNNKTYDVVHCYGLLYHLKDPEGALNYLSNYCDRMLLLETCVSFGEDKKINVLREDSQNPTQAFSGYGCRPTRVWIFEKLKELFQHVYVPCTQPNHEEFPLDWTCQDKHKKILSRAVFIASRDEMNNNLLSPSLLASQERAP